MYGTLKVIRSVIINLIQKKKFRVKIFYKFVYFVIFLFYFLFRFLFILLTQFLILHVKSSLFLISIIDELFQIFQVLSLLIIDIYYYCYSNYIIIFNKRNLGCYWLDFFSELFSENSGAMEGRMLREEWKLDGTHLNPEYVPLLEASFWFLDRK